MSGADVAIVDSGGANIASLQYALDRLGVGSTLTGDPRTIESASHVILPGVGAAAEAMRRLSQSGLSKVIADLRQPVLGICLGMQLFARFSEEERTECLGIVPDSAEKLRPSPQAPVPNIGWCRVRQSATHKLFAGIDCGSYFYFVHSYAIGCGEHTLATADHATPFTAVLAYKNFFASQFHPERSAAAGAKFLSNFLRISS